MNKTEMTKTELIEFINNCPTEFLIQVDLQEGDDTYGKPARSSIN